MTDDRSARIAGYIRRLPPVLWVNWSLSAEDPVAMASLEETLFSDGVLRDLDKPEVVDDVIACVLANRWLRSRVEAEMDDFLDRVAEGASAASKANGPRT